MSAQEQKNKIEAGGVEKMNSIKFKLLLYENNKQIIRDITAGQTKKVAPRAASTAGREFVSHAVAEYKFGKKPDFLFEPFETWVDDFNNTTMFYLLLPARGQCYPAGFVM